jgi:sulfite reductase (NADPH) hemoprotein beta-component
MTGCPNGCARPNAAEIGFIGTSLGHYNLHIGGDRLGMRLNKLYRESLDEAGILNELDILFGTFSKERTNGETFGDFTNRKYFNGSAN